MALLSSAPLDCELPEEPPGLSFTCVSSNTNTAEGRSRLSDGVVFPLPSLAALSDITTTEDQVEASQMGFVRVGNAFVFETLWC